MLLEKLKKEKDEMNRLRMLNCQKADKTKQPVTRIKSNSPMLKTFNQNSNNTKMLTKKRGTNQNLDEINNKKKREESNKENKNGNNLVKIQKFQANIKFLKRNEELSKSKSPGKNLCDDEVQLLSSRIEKFCVISGVQKISKEEKSKTKSKSTLTVCFGNNAKENEEKILDSHINRINNSNFTSNPSPIKSSMRRNFNTNMAPPNENVKEINTQKFKARTISKGLFNINSAVNCSITTNTSNNTINKKQNELETFEMVLQKTRQEKQIIDKKEKDNRKENKINLIKHGKATRMNKENINMINMMSRNTNENMFMEN
jgi:hypothetical protein